MGHVPQQRAPRGTVQQQYQGLGDARTSLKVGVVRRAAKHRAHGLNLLGLLRLDGCVSSVEAMGCEEHAQLISMATLSLEEHTKKTLTTEQISTD